MSKSTVQSQFGTHASAYSTSKVHADGKSLARLVELTNPRPQWSVLDVATGAGHTAALFAPCVGRVVASDITPEMLKEAANLATARGLTNFETVIADAEALPFEADAFDLVTCRLAAHHFPDPKRFVAEACRVLKPGGLLALVDNISPDAVSLPGRSEVEMRTAALLYNAFEKLRDPSHGRALDLAEWIAIMEQCGLTIDTTERATKELDFEDYAERMGCTSEITAELRAMLTEKANDLSQFLAPETREGRLKFHLHEAIVVAARHC